MLCANAATTSVKSDAFSVKALTPLPLQGRELFPLIAAFFAQGKNDLGLASLQDQQVLDLRKQPSKRWCVQPHIPNPPNVTFNRKAISAFFGNVGAIQQSAEKFNEARVPLADLHDRPMIVQRTCRLPLSRSSHNADVTFSVQNASNVPLLNLRKFHWPFRWREGKTKASEITVSRDFAPMLSLAFRRACFGSPSPSRRSEWLGTDETRLGGEGFQSVVSHRQDSHWSCRKSREFSTTIGRN